ncbi:MAG TPA: serine/threonine protein kinase [Saprospiraceae bacterium]|nr:serine/threonine protein kinase [Saprospiraceae bacterium]
MVESNAEKINSLYEKIKLMSPIDGLAYLINKKTPSDIINAVIKKYHALNEVNEKDLTVLKALEKNLNLIGCFVGSIELVKLLGRGGMGEVYLGMDATLQRKVAVKTIRKKYLEDPKVKERFTREAIILSKLNHENICKIHNLIEINETSFLVLEFIEGKSLDKVNLAKLSYSKKLKIAKSILTGVIAAHKKGIIHRDLKPANIILTKENIVKILDFGISATFKKSKPKAQLKEEKNIKQYTKTSHSFTMPGEILGTLAYMSPEQANADEITPATDIYSLGLIFHFLFSNNMPHPKKLKSHELLIRAKIGRSDALQNVPKKLGMTINRMKSVNPTDRPTAVDTLSLIEEIIKYPKKRIRRLALFSIIFLAFLGFAKYTYDLKVQKEQTEIERQNSEQLVEFLKGLFAISNPYENNGENITVRQILDDGAKRIDNELAQQPQRLISLNLVISDVYRNLGMYDVALNLLNKTMKTYDQDKINKVELKIKILLKQAKNAMELSKYKYAEDKFIELFSLTNSKSFLNSTDYLFAKYSWAVLKSKQGRKQEALRDFISLKTYYLNNPNNPNIASDKRLAEIYSSIGLIYWNQNQNNKAKTNLQKGLSLITQLQQKDSKSLENEISIQGNLSLVLADLQEYTQAIKYAKSVIQLREKLLGDKHPDLALAYDNLSFIYYRAKKFDKCIALNLKALSIYSNSIGKNNIEYATTLANRASLLKKIKNYDDAETAQLEVISIYQKIFGDINAHSAKEYFLLAKIHILQNRINQAEKDLQKSLEIYAALHEPQVESEINVWKEYIKLSEQLDDNVTKKELNTQYLNRLKIIKPADT